MNGLTQSTREDSVLIPSTRLAVSASHGSHQSLARERRFNPGSPSAGAQALPLHLRYKLGLKALVFRGTLRSTVAAESVGSAGWKSPDARRTGLLMATVVAMIDNETRYAYTASQLDPLLHVVFDEPHSGWAARMVILLGGRVPLQAPAPGWGDRLRVVTDLNTNWAALNFLHPNEESPTWQGWDSYNPEVSAQSPALPFGSSSLVFPRSAALPLGVVRAAVQEYCATATRPTCVQWQRASYF